MSYALQDYSEQAVVGLDYSEGLSRNNTRFIGFLKSQAGPLMTNRSSAPEADYSIVIPAKGISFNESVRFVISVSNDAARQFKALAERWKNETGHFSLIQQSIAHPAYLEIIGMRDRALPFLMEQVDLRSAQWLPALRAIAGPSRPDEGDTLEEAFNAWTKWWQEKQIKYVRMDFLK